MKWLYKAERPLAERVAECRRIRAKYPHRLPVIVERAGKTHLPDPGRKKFLVPRDFTLGQFYYIVRRRVQLEPKDALFLLIGRKIPPVSALMGELYEMHRDSQDGFLYVAIADESIYGGEGGGLTR
ncbi:gamma-aminobutyric acid receptor-associated protein-like 1 [Penaeus chinensis]|uniref:gamma-aminobutyric acid receptor-associated protein-like 1 n=1 Tax=Penaeus chinensis TaxID=139456 RepID=UPI001FB69205|nr:gamma-aminobutyric acid receptor-associated protein-like 1 [Penaeus chinensis]